MPRVDKEVGLVPSLLDRLIDNRPELGEEPLHQRSQDLRQLKHAVTRDLESLLNTRQQVLEELPAEFAELRRSLLTFGLPDFTTYTIQSLNDRNRIRRAIEQTVATFEPRLERLRVTLEAPQKHDQTLHFRIEALLRVQPAPETVTFDAVLQLSTQAYSVRGRD